jgi:hypothetical protein
MRIMLLFMFTLATLNLSCASGQQVARGHELSLGPSTVRWGSIELQASASRLRGVHLQVERSQAVPQAWAFLFTVFDDLDGDELPSPCEVLAVRQALGSQAGKTIFPSLRWSGRAVRPRARLSFQDGGTRLEHTVAL